MRPMDEQTIFTLLEHRDEAALTALEQRYGPECRKLARDLMGSREDAEEWFSDALLRLWNTLPPPLSPRAWLRKAVRRLALDSAERRNARKRGGGTLPLLLDELAECLPGGEEPEARLLAGELGAALDRFLRAQSPRDRVLFLRRYFDGAPLRDIAKACGMKENSVAAALRRLRERLRRTLEEEGYLT